MKLLVVLISIIVLQACASTNNEIIQTDQMKLEQDKLSNWITHPLEFGQKPSEIKTVYTKLSRWPFTKEQKQVYLHEYTIPGQGTFIGFTGPTTYSMHSINYKQFTYDQLIQIYVGWYAALIMNEEKVNDVEKGKKTCEYIKGSLADIGFNAKRCDNISYKHLSYSAIRGDMGPESNLVLFADGKYVDRNIIALYDFTHLPPLYFYLGKKILSK